MALTITCDRHAAEYAWDLIFKLITARDRTSKKLLSEVPFSAILTPGCGSIELSRIFLHFRL